MKYRVLDNQTAVIVARNPVLLKGKLLLSFSGVDGKTMAAIECSGEVYYRQLVGGSCELDASMLQGVVKITLVDAVLGSLRKRITCEELLVEQTENGTWVYPNDASLPQRVTQICLENEALRKEIKNLEGKIQALCDRFDRMAEGYDIT